MKTFRTMEAAREAGASLRKIFDGRAWMLGGEEVRILSPETLACVDVIEELEWGPSGGVCPCCWKWKRDEGHAPDCKLDLALKKAGVR